MKKIDLLVKLSKEINKKPDDFSEDFVESVVSELEEEDIEARICRCCGKIIAEDRKSVV